MKQPRAKKRSYNCSALLRQLVMMISICLSLTGCTSLSTNKKNYAVLKSKVTSNNFSEAIQLVESSKKKRYKAKDRVVYYLDAGMLYHWSGNYKKSNELLSKAEFSIEEYTTKSLALAASSLLVNDNITPYEGEDYEDVYINVFKALNYLALNESDKAFVEVRRINNKLNKLEDRYVKKARLLSAQEEVRESVRPGKSRFTDSVLARYLSLLLYRNDGKWDDARIDFKKINQAWRTQPTLYDFTEPTLEAELKPISSPLARLNIVAFNGLAPDKRASTFYIHTEENLIILGSTQENYLGRQELSGLNAIPWPDIPDGYHFKFQLPSLKKNYSSINRIEVIITNGVSQELQKIESIENAAIETFRIKKPILYLRSLTRAIMKGLSAERTKQKITDGMGTNAAFLTRILTDIAVDKTENADLRISRFFPANASVAEIHLPEGTYTLRINYYSLDHTLVYSDLKNNVSVTANRINLIESVCLN